VPYWRKNIKKLANIFQRKVVARVLVYLDLEPIFTIIFALLMIFTYILLSRATSYHSLLLVVLRRDHISVLGSRL